MKLHILWFSITALIVGTTPLLILFIWCSINGFGIDVVRVFESIHPSGGLSIIENIDSGIVARMTGVAIDTAYAALDFLILGFAFSTIYNFFVNKFDKAGSGD